MNVDTDIDIDIDIEYNYHSNYELIINKDNYLSKGLCGLLNIGNTCYLNSILQCLFATLKLSDYFLSYNFNEDVNKKYSKIVNNYYKLLESVFEYNQLIKPKSIIESIGTFDKRYITLEQQDSHEFLINFLELLHKGIRYDIDIEIKGGINNIKSKYIENWSKNHKNNYSIIIELFYGYIFNNIKCNNCKYSDKIFEPFNTLSISITSDSLEGCLDNYFEEYNIDEWNCEKCENKGCNKKSKLWSLPNYLIINLKRFKTDEKNKLHKNIENVKFPLSNLNLTKYITKEKNDENNYIYDCYAVNYHTGNLNNGHYYSIVKNLNKSWYLMNDGNVSIFRNVNNMNNNAYIIFYHRRFIK